MQAKEAQLKICVLVKEVPDAAVEKRIDPSTGRLDRSGEKNLNPYDTHAIEAAMQIREGGAVEVDEIVAVTMGPESAVRALHKAVSLGADRSVHLTDEALAGSDVAATGYALAKALETESARPGPARPAVRRRRVLHDRRRRGRPPADALAHAGDQDGRRRTARCAASARPSTATTPSQVELPGRDLGRRRDQRAALPVAEGDHGREEEAAGDASRRRRRHRRRAVGDDGSRVQCGDFHDPPAKAAGQIIEDEDTNETVEKIVAWLDERKLSGMMADILVYVLHYEGEFNKNSLGAVSEGARSRPSSAASATRSSSAATI